MMLHSVVIESFGKPGPTMRLELTLVGDEVSIAREFGADLLARLRPHTEAALEKILNELASRHRGSGAYARAIDPDARQIIREDSV